MDLRNNGITVSTMNAIWVAHVVEFKWCGVFTHIHDDKQIVIKSNWKELNEKPNLIVRHSFMWMG